jgi:hypothetical protein
MPISTKPRNGSFGKRSTRRRAKPRNGRDKATTCRSGIIARQFQITSRLSFKNATGHSGLNLRKTTADGGKDRGALQFSNFYVFTCARADTPDVVSRPPITECALRPIAQLEGRQQADAFHALLQSP